MNQIEDNVFVSGQIVPDDMDKLCLMGIRSIINNRPDGETPGQPSHAHIQSAAREVGFTCHHVPMGGVVTPEIISASIDAYADTPKPILAYCRSGLRSATLWAFARVQVLGVTGVMDRISDAGYDLERIRPALESCAQIAQKK
ncbi:MAG: TIGR01244 family phosphatase [Hyphomonadaceae bacterium]|nr:TIGR01244 family phosphatase [Hyphomonadaceae bacterium]MBC6411906.1 TIGR01244 family phosphatase [Hyphomonadaceae bacterium]